MSLTHIHTSESVGEGHPDKLADQISDAILDDALRQDKRSRVAIETLVTHGLAVIAGELSMEGYIDMAKIVRQTINEVGYTDTELGMDGNTCGVMISVQEQSTEIAQGVDTGGAGDQGMMFGLATRETPEMMPLPLAMAHALTRRSAEVRRKHPSLGLRPDVKSQVSVVYEDGVAQKVETVVLSQQHSPSLNLDSISEVAREYIISPVLEEYGEYVNEEPKIWINPTGSFTQGGPHGDTGLTGRKIIVDTYGGLCPHGGGAFSGKDPTKVDRSAAYMARHVAKCVVASGLAERCVISFAYAIGVPEPVSVNVETFGTESVEHAEIVKRVRGNFDLTPAGIIKHLGLLDMKYLPTAKNGHFGNPAFPWERTDMADALRS
ncbi:MAG: methionine adenosyltransferase [Fimbriimonadaceae bacterium]|nr:methionine adenosyltransferase [Fimbriimonadaceae bacterium]